jgi:hypothetical protein
MTEKGTDSLQYWHVFAYMTKACQIAYATEMAPLILAMQDESLEQLLAVTKLSNTEMKTEAPKRVLLALEAL